jgi:UDP-N-acetylglucosamine 2-epimerase (non-hydrolysing)
MEQGMIKVLFLLGTRPEAIKLAPLVIEFSKRPAFEVKVAITAQHREMLDQVLQFFEVKPDFDLNIMKPNQQLPELTARIIQSVTDEVLSIFKADWVIVQGDTTTAMAGALAAFYAKIKIAHVEAGLRSFNLQAPFPEEMNRVFVSRIANIHFCPTTLAANNLFKEGIEKNVYTVGNTVVDAVLNGQQRLPALANSFEKYFDRIDLQKKILLVTCHRRESFGDPFLNICKAFVRIAAADPDVLFVYPVHLNPNIREKALEYLGSHKQILLLDPLPYAHLLWLMNASTLILTDSGGIQEEAPSLNKPVIVLRDVTERMEGIEMGTAILTGTETDKIVNATLMLLQDSEVYQAMACKPNPYGDGNTSARIAQLLIEHSK